MKRLLLTMVLGLAACSPTDTEAPPIGTNCCLVCSTDTVTCGDECRSAGSECNEPRGCACTADEHKSANPDSYDELGCRICPEGERTCGARCIGESNKSCSDVPCEATGRECAITCANSEWACGDACIEDRRIECDDAGMCKRGTPRDERCQWPIGRGNACDSIDPISNPAWPEQ